MKLLPESPVYKIHVCVLRAIFKIIFYKLKNQHIWQISFFFYEIQHLQNIKTFMTCGDKNSVEIQKSEGKEEQSEHGPL